MPVIWIEGLDRCGKDSQCKLLINYIKPVITIHGYAAKGLTSAEQRKLQFENAQAAFELFNANPSFNFLCNRSHLGEIVYGNLYRGYNPAVSINCLETLLQKNMNNFSKSIYFFIDENIDILMEREDGNSFSNTKELKKRERDFFLHVIEQSIIPNKHIIISNGRTREDIHYEILKEVKRIWS